MINIILVIFKLLLFGISYIDGLVLYSDANFYSRKRLCAYQHCILHICGPWFMVQHRWL